MKKVILILLDGLEYIVARDCMGFLKAMTNENLGRIYKVKCELPSISRPLYECILTGVNPVNSGIFNNQINRLSKEKSIFYYVKQANLLSAAAAYYWVSELYNKTPFDTILDRHIQNLDFLIPYAHFYYEDTYPDSHVFSDGESLRVKYNPHFLFIHSMNIDDVGHKFGYNSKEYKNQARKVDDIISSYLKKWLDDGYNVIITSDHGMNNDFSHGGNLDIETDVAFFVFGDKFSFDDCEVKQTEICGNICEIMGINHDKIYTKELIK